MRIDVRNGNLDRALKVMRRKLADDGMFRELQEKQAYEKPSERRRRKLRSAIVRERKMNVERHAGL
jgi:small subunit ribosomal protein S21